MVSFKIVIKMIEVIAQKKGSRVPTESLHGLYLNAKRANENGCTVYEYLDNLIA